jgi:DNA modification methylase
MKNDETLPLDLQSSSPKPTPTLVEKWIIPPFSVFDTKQGYWSTRKAKWLALGIESEVGRGEELTYRKLDETRFKTAKHTNKKSTSTFDPVLCEVLLRWFSRPGASVLDPFAGGSVRGIVAGSLGMHYTGIELREEQVLANRAQIDRIPVEVPPFWIVGDSSELVSSLPGSFDFVFSCPPYADLEVYSDDPRDISTMEYEQFLATYSKIIGDACSKLSDNRFAAFVVSEVRNKKTGIYRGFVADTIRAFEAAGLGLYNDVVLLNNVGTAAIRANLNMNTRKLVRVHQNVLVFVKGDPRKAVEWINGGSDQLGRSAA